MDLTTDPVRAQLFPALDALATAVLLLDENLRVQYMNLAAEQLLGSGAKKCYGRPIIDLLELPADLRRCLREAVHRGQPFTDRQVRIEPAGADAVLVDCVISPQPRDAAPPLLILEFNTVDLPQRIARDQAAAAQQEHVRLLLRGLAHEVKNPLGGLRGAAQLLDRQLGSDELRDYTSIIIAEADRLQGLIDRMLGPANRPQLAPVNVHEVLEHVRRIARAAAPPSVRLAIDYDPSIPELISDRDRLVQVLLNIVGNALNAVGSRGTVTFRSRVLHNVTVGCRMRRLVAALEIRDDGPGVPEQLLDQIFYPMVSGSDHGSGLGLSIAQSMMNQLGGFIDCRSEPGNTVFTVLAPLELP